MGNIQLIDKNISMHIKSIIFNSCGLKGGYNYANKLYSKIFIFTTRISYKIHISIYTEILFEVLIITWIL